MCLFNGGRLTGEKRLGINSMQSIENFKTLILIKKSNIDSTKLASKLNLDIINKLKQFCRDMSIVSTSHL